MLNEAEMNEFPETVREAFSNCVVTRVECLRKQLEQAGVRTTGIIIGNYALWVHVGFYDLTDQCLFQFIAKTGHEYPSNTPWDYSERIGRCVSIPSTDVHELNYILHEWNGISEMTREMANTGAKKEHESC